jgi:hypothetical protein
MGNSKIPKLPAWHERDDFHYGTLAEHCTAPNRSAQRCSSTTEQTIRRSDGRPEGFAAYFRSDEALCGDPSFTEDQPKGRL